MQTRPEIRSVGLMGFGAFGRLIVRHLSPLVPIIVHDPMMNNAPASITCGTPLQVAQCDLIILAVPVSALDTTLKSIAPHLRSGAIVADVASVKIGPVQAMVRLLPSDVQIVGTHPLFGPQSAKEGVQGRKIAVCRIRGDACLTLAALMRRHLGLRPFLVTAEEHDHEAAIAQGLTHFIARAMTALEPLPNRLTTASFDCLCEAIDMVRHDPPGVFHAIEQDNPFAASAREKFMARADALMHELVPKNDVVLKLDQAV